MESTDALAVAVALHAMPTRAATLRRSPLPAGVTDLLKVALGQEGPVASGVAAIGSTPRDLIDSAKFFVEQLVLARECESDPWRTLGVRSGSPLEQITENRRLLLSLIHPDRSDDWAEGYADRLNRAWKLLKSPDSRRMLVDRATGAGNSDVGGTDVAPDSQWDERPARHESYDHRGDGVGSHVGRVFGVQVSASDGNSSVRTPSSKVARPWLSASAGIACAVLASMLWPDEPNILASRTQLTDARGAASSQTAPTTLVDEHVQVVHAAGDTAPGVLRPVEELARHSARQLAQPMAELTTPATSQTALAVVREVAADGVITVSARAQDQASEPAVSAAGPNQSPAQQLQSQRSLGAAQSVATLRRSVPVVRRPSLPEEQFNTAETALSAPSLNHSSARAEAEQTVAPSGERLTDDAPAVTASAALPTSREASDVLGKFAMHYAKGNLDALLALFSSHQLSDGGASIAADYGNLFSSTRERTLALKGVGWMAQDDRLVGQGSYEARYRQQGKVGRQVVSGRIHFELVREGETIRFARVSSQEATL